MIDIKIRGMKNVCMLKVQSMRLMFLAATDRAVVAVGVSLALLSTCGSLRWWSCGENLELTKYYIKSIFNSLLISGEYANLVFTIEQTNTQIDFLVPSVFKSYCFLVTLWTNLKELDVFVPFKNHLITSSKTDFWFLKRTKVWNPAVRDSQDMLRRFLLVFRLS